MPSNQSPLGALPARFRRERLLIVGCGDVGMRVAMAMPRGTRLLALTSNPQRTAELRQQGIAPLLGNLDDAKSLKPLAGLGTRILYLAPPPAMGSADPRILALLRALRGRSLPAALVYGSTSGVYGDCAGEWVTETRAVRPATARAQRRVDAERTVRWWGRSGGVRSSVLRIPGIYAANREGGDPRERVRKGTPVLQASEDVYTNHIHADDLARACIAALWRAAPQRVYHASDDTQMKMGDYLDAVASIAGLPLPPRITRAQAEMELSPMTLSFWSESRRLDNRRFKTELRVRLRYPAVQSGLA
ncbi:MAG: SDR family oxidoreductase [Rhodoferax sp.]|nr:SDR family oxidoreductase [Rhodoferax sp.]